MKVLLTVFVLLGIINLLQAQSAYLQVRVMKREGGPYADAVIVMKEVRSGIEKKAKTNFQGVAVLLLEGGNEWKMSVDEMHAFKSVYMPKEGRIESKMVVTYDPQLLEFKRHPQHSRDTIVFREVSQKGKRYLKADEGNSLVILKIRNEQLAPITSRTVSLVSIKTATVYLGRTNSIGEVRFNVPKDDIYEIDIHTDKFISYATVPQDAGEEVKMKILYEPTTIRETAVNDTISQSVPKSMHQGTSGRVLVDLYCANSEGFGAAGETVWLNKIGDSIVYKATTNETGLARFLLPDSEKYMIQFEYQKNVDVIDLVRNYGGGMGLYRKKVMYRINRALAYPEEFIPDTNELFLEEYSNFLTRQFPKPTKAYVGILPSFIAKVNSTSKEAILEIGISSVDKEQLKSASNAPHNLCFVLDVSGSMAGYERIESLQEALIQFTGKLSSTDKVALVTFNDEPKLNITSKPLGTKTAFQKEIRDLFADGGTNILDGLELGYKEILKNYSPKSVNRVVLLSDGYGSRPVPDILKMSGKYNDKGAEITTIGVGRDFNYPLLKSLSTAQGGFFYYAGRSAKIFDAFGAELERLIKPIASDCTIEVEYNSKVVYRQLYGYSASKKGNNTVQIDIGSVFPGLNSLALIKFELDTPTKEIEEEPLIIRFTYKDLTSNTIKSEEHTVALEWEDSEGDTELFYEEEPKKLYALAVANQTLKIMSDLYSQNKLKEAYRKLKTGNKTVEKLTEGMLSEEIIIARGKLQQYKAAFERLFKKKGITDYD